MNLSHHIADDMLLAYSAGHLSESWSLLVATHLALCPTCRETVRQFETVGGVLLETLSAEGMGANSFDRAMQVIDDLSTVPTTPDFVPVKRTAPSILPEPLLSYVGGDLHAVKWSRLGMGVFHVPIKTGDKRAKARLLKVPAGQPVPMHSHSGSELTLVLVGAFQTYQGTFHRGDVEAADGAVEHMPIAIPGVDCICLAVTDAPLRFRSFAARLIQPFIGI